MRPLIACAFAAVLAGCVSFDAPDPAAAPEPPLVVDLRGHRVDLQVGERVEFRLPGHPAADHRWALVDPLPGVLRAGGVPRDEIQRAALGRAPREEVWPFEAVRAGSGTLRFEYRPLRGPAGREPAQRATFRIEVR